MRSRFVVLSLVVAAAITCWLTQRSAADNPNRAQVGKKIDNVKFTDITGKTFALYDLKDKKAIVLVFLSFECPVSTSYSQPLAEMAKDYERLGVSFIGLSTNQDDTVAELQKQVKECALNFPVALDRNFVVANAVKAEITPEVFVLDGNYVLQYRGRIDDGYYARLKKSHEITKHDLKQVLAEIVSGRPVSFPRPRPSAS